MFKNCRNKPKPLPVGVNDFHHWSDRIIVKSGLTATQESQKFALAAMVVQLGAEEAAKDDAYFVNRLKKSAATQVAQHIMKEIKDDRAKREETKQGEDIAKNSAPGEILPNTSI